MIEALERRRLLTSTGEWYGNPDAMWFGAVATPARMDHAEVADQPAARFVVRLDEQISAAIGSARESWQVFYGATVLPADVVPPWVQFRAIAGLGLPGQILVEAYNLPDQSAEALSRLPHVVSVERERSIGGAQSPDDARFPEQYGLNNTGQTGGTDDADIDAPEAWDLQTGSAAFVVAHIDSGIDYTHPDLAANIWTNPGEMGALANNGVDDDNNGFVDDVHGYDFVNNDPDPMDDNGHGTHTAGTIGAVGNNNIQAPGGVSGVAWTTSLMALKFLDRNLKGTTSDAIEAFNYMTMMKTRVLNPVNIVVSNNSWGFSGGIDVGLRQAIQAAGDAGILTVAAAGNGNALNVGINNDESPFYPASFAGDTILSVASSDKDDRLAPDSNFGRTSVDIAAPGVGILSTLPGGEYGTKSGTSMAAAHVSGVAALVFAEHPNATPQEVRSAIFQGVDKGEILKSKLSTGGRLNALGALHAETFAPRAILSSKSDIATPQATSSDDVIVAVQYTDNDAIQAASIDASDIGIRRVGHSNRNAVVTLRDAPPAADVSSLTVAYRVRPSDGTWDALDQGIYEIVVNAGHVLDRQGTAAPSVVLGTFSVTVVDPLVIVVDSFQDAPDANLQDQLVADSQGRRTLRAAIQHINARPPANYTIALRDGDYALSIAGRTEEAAATGDLDILKRVKIVGTGTSTTTINAQSLDRVFDVIAGGDLTLSLLTITGGLTSAATGDRDGGGIQNRGTLKLDKMDVVGNTANSSGGGLVNEASGNATIEDTDLLHNSTQDPQGNGGGGIRNTGILTLLRSTLAFNVTPAGLLGTGGGGGLINVNNTADQVTVVNSTFSNNRALNGTGGGILNEGRMSVESSTITENRAEVGTAGGIRTITLNGVVIGNSIVADNFAAIVPDGFGLPYALPDVRGQFKSTGFNLIGVTTQLACCESLEGFTSGRPPGSLPEAPTLNDRIGFQFKPLTASLGPLRDNGGHTLTHEPLEGSPAIDLGGGLTTFTGTHEEAPQVDQRGFPRRFLLPTGNPSKIDTGAVERFHGQIRGVKFIDRNGNAMRDADEPGLPGWTVYVDMNENLSLDQGEPHAITLQDNPLTPTLDESGSYELSNVTPGNYLIRSMSQGGFAHTSPISIRRSPPIAFQALIDRTTPLPGQSIQFFGSLDQVILEDELLTFSDQGQRRIFLAEGPSTPSLLVAPGAAATNGSVLEQIFAHQQDGENIAILARPAGKSAPELFVRQAGGAITPIANPNPAISIPAQTLPSGLFTISGGIVLFVNNGQLFASSRSGAVSVSAELSVDDPRLDTERGYFSFTAGDPANSNEKIFKNNNRLTGLFIGLGQSFTEIGTQALDRGSVAFTASKSGGFEGMYVGESPETIRPLPVDTNTFAPGSTTVKFRNLVADTGQPLFFPSIAFEDGTVVFASEDTSGNFGLYAIVAGVVVKIITINETLAGRDIVNLKIEPNNALSENRLAFQAEFSDGTDAVYLAEFGSVEGHQVQVFPTQSVSGLDFGVIANPAEIHGVAFNDVNRNGFKDDNDPVLPGRKIFLDFNNNGEPEENEPTKLTDDTGSYFFDAGDTIEPLQTYTIAIAIDPLQAEVQTAPMNNNGRYVITPGAGEIVTGINFGLASIPAGGSSNSSKLTGTLLISANGDGVLAAGARRLAELLQNVVVFVDQNGDGRLQSGEPVTTPDSRGQYSFGGLENSNVQIRVMRRPGMSQTSPLISNSFSETRYDIPVKPEGAAAGDFDHRNGADLAVTMSNADQVWILTSDADGELSVLQKLNAHNRPGGIAVDDLNNDGWSDLIVSNSYNGDISVFINQKNSTTPFSSVKALHYPTQNISRPAGVPQGIAVGLFDADQLPDIAVANQGAKEVAIFLNNTVGTNVDFDLMSRPAAGKNPLAVVSGLFTGDEHLDLAVVNNGDGTTGSSSVSILRGNGLGAFNAFLTIPVADGPTAIDTGDLNNDMLADLVITNFAVNKITILWGQPAGQFSKQEVSAGVGPSSVVIVDVENDGDDDIAISNGSNATNKNHLLVIRNQGGGVFSAAEPAGSATFFPNAAFSVVVANFDGKSGEDLALVNPILSAGAGNATGQVAVYSNQIASSGSLSIALETPREIVGLDFGLAFFRHNVIKALDVTGDGGVVAADALDVINYLNAFGAQSVPENLSAFGPFYDVTADGTVAANDALEVINFLNAFGPDVEGEPARGALSPESPSDDSRQSLQSQDDLLALLALDVSLQSKSLQPRRRR